MTKTRCSVWPELAQEWLQMSNAKVGQRDISLGGSDMVFTDNDVLFVTKRYSWNIAYNISILIYIIQKWFEVWTDLMVQLPEKADSGWSLRIVNQLTWWGLSDLGGPPFGNAISCAWTGLPLVGQGKETSLGRKVVQKIIGQDWTTPLFWSFLMAKFVTLLQGSFLCPRFFKQFGKHCSQNLRKEK